MIVYSIPVPALQQIDCQLVVVFIAGIIRDISRIGERAGDISRVNMMQEMKL